MLGKLLDRRVAWGVALFSFLIVSSCGSDPMAGAIGTGNAGRIHGQVVASGNVPASRLAARLVSVGTSEEVVDSTRCDSNGIFTFPEHQTGKYRVEIWQNGKFHGSRTFQLAGDVTGLVIVLVEAIYQQELDLSRIGNVDSVYIDYRQNQGIRVGDRWVVQTTRDSAFVVHAHLAGPPERWEEWVVVRREGRDVLVNISDNRSLDLARKIDSGAFLLTPRTVALWDFDSLRSQGEILDRSPFANHLRYTGNSRLVPSPHGMAFLQESGIAATVPHSGELAPSLQWTRTGTMTWEIRFRMDTVPLSGMVVLGSQSGIRLWVTGARQIVVESPVTGPDGSAIGSLVSASDVVPLGRWTDIAISLDGPARQVYAWVDEVPQRLAARTYWDLATIPTLFPTGEFGIGGSAWDPRRSQFQIDEARISDTLVHGKGLEIQPTSQETIFVTEASELAQVFDAIGAESCGDCSTLLAGMQPSTGRVGGIAWRPRLPSSLQGRRIASALLVFWTSAPSVGERRDFFVGPVRSSWSGQSGPLVWNSASGVRFGSMSSLAPDNGSLLVPGNSGGLIFEAARMVQAWVDHPETNFGFLVRAVDESVPGTQFSSSGSVRPPSLVVRYW